MVIHSFTAVLCLLLFAISSSGNIVFHWVQPSCNLLLSGWNGCLKGQVCEVNGTCHAPPQHRLTEKRAFSTDGRCGPNFGNVLCDPNSVYPCCSRYGYCGNTPAHCETGSGCVSGCTSQSASSFVTTTRPGVAAPFTAQWITATIDGVVVSWIYGPTPAVSSTTASSTPPIVPATSNVIHLATSSSAGEPILGQDTAAIASATPAPTGAVTTDGTCGATHGGTVCGDWSMGSCCSSFGWCGSTSAHCGDGCQSGPCLNGVTVDAPGPAPAPANANPGSFEVVGQSGVPVMHAALMPNGRAVFLDKVENYTQLTLSDGYYAYSSEYDPTSNQVVPLTYATNAFCSGGSFLANGTLLNIGGNAPLSFIDPTVGNGFQGLRYLTRSSTDASLNGQSWSEPGNLLNTARWYASAQTMADGTIFVASGSLNGLDPAVTANNNPTYEILNAQGITNGQSINMDILVKNQPYYMYPFLHLLRDGSLFVFVSKSAELFDVGSGGTIKTFTDLPGEFRTYPNTGGSVMLPLSSSNNYEPQVMICGGGAYQDVTSPTDASCGRIQPLSDTPAWELEAMPEGRTMVEGTLLPDGTVIWLNGCSEGAQGFGLGADPAYEALIYDPSAPLGQRFTTGATSGIARLYHSVAFLLLDGTIMVAGSNPVEQPMLQADANNPYVTEFRVEVYTPPYLSGNNALLRPTNIVLSTATLTANSSSFNITFTAPANANTISIALYHGGFITHSLHMGQRLVYLDSEGFVAGQIEQEVTVTMTPNGNVSPPGPYVVYVLVDGVPGVGQFVSVSV